MILVSEISTFFNFNQHKWKILWLLFISPLYFLLNSLKIFEKLPYIYFVAICDQNTVSFAGGHHDAFTMFCEMYDRYIFNNYDLSFIITEYPSCRQDYSEG